MTPLDIQKEWDSFIEYPERSNKMYVTTTSALLFARHITDIAAANKRDEIIRWLEGCEVDEQGRLILSRAFIVSNLKTMEQSWKSK